MLCFLQKGILKDETGLVKQFFVYLHLSYQRFIVVKNLFFAYPIPYADHTEGKIHRKQKLLRLSHADGCADHDPERDHEFREPSG